MKLVDHRKERIEDKELDSDVRDESFTQKSLSRIYAVRRTFVDVSFKQSELVNCYFRNCRFIRCDFTGALISSSNFRGSQYEDCKFHYSTWQHTFLDAEFLDSCLPSEENLARDLVRTLRVNFGHIGDYPAVNKAASLEVALTGQHLFNATYSKQSYYRSKYKGLSRIYSGLRHLRWKALDLLWGNGESILRVACSGAVFLLAWTVFLAWQTPDFGWKEALSVGATAFWGVPSKMAVPDSYLAVLAAVRYLLVGLFMAILIKRLSRR